MPRYSTASASEGESAGPRQIASPHQQQGLNSTPAFQLPFASTSQRHNGQDSSDDEGGDGNDEEDEDEEEEEGAWDEVDIPNPNQPTTTSSTAQTQDPSQAGAPGGGTEKGIEIVFDRPGSKLPKSKKKSTALTLGERKLRQELHKVHTMTLLSMSLVRNKWLNDKELQARLLSQLPSSIHSSLASITRDRYPNPRDRSRLFEATLKDLLSWWFQAFKVVPGRELRRKGIGEVEEEMSEWKEEYERLRKKELKGKAKEVEMGSKYSEWPWEEPTLSLNKRQKLLKSQSTSSSSSSSLIRPFVDSPATWEPLASISSLYAAASTMKGSKDLSVQLFTALLRALDVPTRLVVSLQGVEWRSDSAAGITKKGAKETTKKGTGKKGAKGKGKEVETIELNTTDSGSDGDDHWEDGRGKINYKVPKVNLRRSGPSTKKLANWQKEKQMMRSPSPDPEEMQTPPAQWPEVYSRYLKEWVTLDPVRKLLRCKSRMEPKGGLKSGGGNSLVYVVGFEEDGSAHDLTPRYSKSFNNVTMKLRVPTSSKSKKEKGGKDWFESLLEPFKRPYQLNRDKIEEEELWNRSKNEPFPTSFGGFKNHPNYVLEQHLHRDEALLPGTRSLGLFKSTTPVYPRSSVLLVKSSENWYRTGRVVKENEIPRKFVKGRAVTINSKRREELVKMDGGEIEDQALWSEDQTEVFVPDPVVDGKVPKNSFGNIDLFVPSMLPEGAVHLPSKLASKCAKMLQIDYAEAIIGFEFRQRRATPTLRGIVVASEHAPTLREAIANLEEQQAEKEFAQKQDRVLKRWKKVVLGLRIRERLKGEFGAGEDREMGIVGEAATGVGSANTSASGTPRFTSLSASKSPAPIPQSTSKSRSTSSRKNSRPLAATSSSARKRPSSRRSPSSSASSSSGSHDSSTYSDQAAVKPPPRKRRETRSTRSSVAASNSASTANDSSSLKIRLPASTKGPPTANGGGSGKRGVRPVRASALKAKENLRAATQENDAEDQWEQVEGVDMGAGGVGGSETNGIDEENGIAMENGNESEKLQAEAGGFIRTGTAEADDTTGGGEENGDTLGNAEVVEEEQDEYGFEYESD